VSRTDRDACFHAEAYAFESPLDVKFFSQFGDDQREGDEDDDDDDDDNDGSCSMLSNASISRVTVPDAQQHESEPQPTNGAKSQSRLKIRGGAQARVPWTTQQSRSAASALRQALQVRGGGSSGGGEALASEVLKRLFVSAFVTLIFEACMGHILEFLKILKQTSTTKVSYAQVIQDITAEKGIGGLWDGFVPWGVVQAIFKGAVFGLAHTSATRVLVPLADEGRLPLALALTLAGGIGGGFQGYVLSPTLLLKTRVMTNPVFRERMSLWKTTLLSARIGMDVVRTEGVLALMKGANIFATKRVFDWATRFFFADGIESILTKWKGGLSLTLAEKSMASLMGGVLSTCCTLPLDVLVAKTQDAKKAGVQVSALVLFRDELREKGWSGLSDAYLQGFEARLLHVCLTVVVIKTWAPVVYTALFG
jgi:hypothetical protein